MRFGKAMIFLLFVVLVAACQKSESKTFDALMNGNVINKVEFRDGGSGYLYRTEDQSKIGDLQSLLNSKKVNGKEPSQEARKKIPHISIPFYLL